jgi:fumarylpyruvate hydrolase
MRWCATTDLHHEIELVVAIGRDGADLPLHGTLSMVFGYAAGIDLTRRDLQAAAKKAGKPWDMAKGFDHSAPISAIVPVASSGHVAKGHIELRVNGSVRQSGDVADMIWDVPHIIAHLSSLVTLRQGDLIFTGTPAGVAAVSRGDELEGVIDGVGAVWTTIV